ncbi:hypothetical protein [Shewanella ulleungensis]|uniref:DUF4189 domain-containing protein n=1 Tax=Shewanella ulleungensis TaxID=2282699 RepID=A0ABQ2QFU7_9GAMM|nr:hypothetical protein [Shewanella ulleungensis]MCL1149579.1 DUF4189 domain-containing protein [Shewanella ulleungensis]GGP80006.1 hypothetical protein GCM10009410_10810 [Shewanella ulleungensis]
MKALKVIIITILSALALYGLVAILLGWLLSSMCGNTVYTESLSLDKMYKAVIFERSCGGASDFSTQISIIKADEQLCDNCAGDVLIANGHPNNNKLNLVWLGQQDSDDQHLQIHIPADIIIETKETMWSSWFDNIDISYPVFDHYPLACEQTPQPKACQFVTNDQKLIDALVQFKDFKNNKALAVAVSESGHIRYGYGFGYDSMLKAQRRALKECIKGTSPTHVKCELIR